MKILMTGGTGFIGQRLAIELSRLGHEILILTRKESFSKAKNIFKHSPEITLIEGDIIHSDVISNLSVVSNVVDQIECVIHLAALYDLQASHSDSYLMNVVGTQNLINLMKKMNKLKFFHYFSTYAVNPLVSGIIKEDFLMEEIGSHLDHYTKTKNTAEFLVRKSLIENVQTIIHRPGIIIGDSRTGKMDKMDGPYFFFSFIKKLKNVSTLMDKIKYLPLPVKANAKSPILPVDTLVEWCCEIIMKPKEGQLNCYHLIPRKSILTKNFLEYSMLLLNLPLNIIYLNLPAIFVPIFKVIKMPKELLFFMSQEASLDRSKLEADFPHLIEKDYQEYLPIIINQFLDSEK